MEETATKEVPCLNSSFLESKNSCSLFQNCSQNCASRLPFVAAALTRL